MCECSGVVYMENSEYCHECGEKFRVCENCKVNSRYNKGKFCHMCGTCFEKMEKKEPLHQVEEKKKSKDSQFLALVYLIGIQNPHEIFKTLIELLMEECYYSMPRCEKELQDMWHMRSVISTQQLIDIQLFKIGTQSRDMVRDFFSSAFFTFF